MPNSHALPTDPPVSAVERPRCMHCQVRMNLAGITPGLAGYELRTFECTNCNRVQRTLVVADPFSSDASMRKWLKDQFNSSN
jgi:hypothetical protein